MSDFHTALLSGPSVIDVSSLTDRIARSPKENDDGTYGNQWT
jgi:hypothetical protein